MTELLEQINFLHWLSLGLVLLTLELISSGGYFLWLGFSALAIGITLCIHDVPWGTQWHVFTGFAFLTCFLWWRDNVYKRPEKKKDYPHLDGNQLIGQTIRIEESVLEGEFFIQIGRYNWLAITETPIVAGSIITIRDYDGLRLIVKKRSNVMTYDDNKIPSDH